MKAHGKHWFSKICRHADVSTSFDRFGALDRSVAKHLTGALTRFDGGLLAIAWNTSVDHDRAQKAAGWTECERIKNG